MNETDVKDLFASAVAHPGVDRIDTGAILRVGRRRRRGRVAAGVGMVAAVVAVAGSLVVGGSRHPGIIAVPTVGPSDARSSEPVADCRAAAWDTPQNGLAHVPDAVDAAADRMLAAATALPLDNLSVLNLNHAARTVEVRWVGPVPQKLRDLAAHEAARGIAVTFATATYTRTQMQEATQLADSVPPPADDPASAGLRILASACPDGSGIVAMVMRPGIDQPAPSVSRAFAAAIQARVGDMPVRVVGGSLSVSAAGAQP